MTAYTGKQQTQNSYLTEILKDFYGRTGEDAAIAQTTLFLVDRNSNFQWQAEDKGEDEDGEFVDPSNPPQKGCNKPFIRWWVRRLVQHLAFRIVTLLLILVDVAFLTVDLVKHCHSPRLSQAIAIADLVISSIFVLEIAIRLYAITPGVFFSKKLWFNHVDFVVVAITFSLSIVNFVLEDISCLDSEISKSSNTAVQWVRIATLLRVLRFVRLIRLVRIYTEHHQLKRGIRQLVSQNKRRYQEDGVDLDLTYVTDRIVAMSFPSSGHRAWYRNNIGDVAHFLDKKHAGHYLVYNLCSERTYDPKYFGGQVVHFPVDDHNVPTVRQMLSFVKNVKLWLESDAQNVIAVHCKGGKGRTGTLICVLLVDSGCFHNAHTSLSYFGHRRTDTNVSDKFQGVETASQIRYVDYFEQLKRQGLQSLEEERRVQISEIRISGCVGKGDGSDLSVEVSSSKMSLVYKLKSCAASQVNKSDAAVVVADMTKCPVVAGDVRIRFFCSSSQVPKGYEDCAFFFWFHTSFLKQDEESERKLKLHLTRDEVDNPHKPRAWSIYKEDFSIDLYAEPR